MWIFLQNSIITYINLQLKSFLAPSVCMDSMGGGHSVTIEVQGQPCHGGGGNQVNHGNQKKYCDYQFGPSLNAIFVNLFNICVEDRILVLSFAHNNYILNAITSTSFSELYTVKLVNVLPYVIGIDHYVLSH